MSEQKLIDRLELRLDERGRGFASANGHDLRCTLTTAVETASAESEEVTIRLEAVVDKKVLADLATQLKPKIQAKVQEKKAAAPPAETPEETS